MFIPDLAHMNSPLRPLMKRDAAWTWLQGHEEAFMKTKELLTSTSLVKPFDETKETLMLTDASRLYGLGFALIQNHKTAIASPSLNVAHAHSAKRSRGTPPLSWNA